jgi:uncharacterized SAM-binding protein YcdF (DUF218 family)
MRLLVALGKRLNNDGSFHPEMQDRCNAVYKGLVENSYDKALLCGGLANAKAGITEAEAMKDYLVERGIASDRLILEDHSKTTYQNAKYAKPIITGLGVDTIYLCSSSIHLERRYLNPIRLFRARLGKRIVIIPVYADK